MFAAFASNSQILSLSAKYNKSWSIECFVIVEELLLTVASVLFGSLT